MIVSVRRRWLLFVGQTVIGAAAVLLCLVVVALGAGTGFWALIGVPLVLSSSVWGLVLLERRKFPKMVLTVVNWVDEVRSVRDSRRVIVGAFEIERRRIERDLHDGTQQYLVAAAMKLGEAGLHLEPERGTLSNHEMVATLVEGAHRDVEEALTALRATVSGIHPQMLSDLGLLAAVTDLAERSGLDATIRCPHTLPNMPDDIAAVAWFFCSEAVTNVLKHAPRAAVTILLIADQELHVSVLDSGPGGAELRPGGGLSGMRERLAAFGGTLVLSSPPGGPTTVTATIPLLLLPAAERSA